MYVNGEKTYQLKVKVSEIKLYPLCLGNISKDFTVDNMKTSWLNECAYNFSVDYNTVDISDVVDIH